MEMVEGYGIHKTILFKTRYGIALGRTPEAPGSFAVWNFTETAYGRDYYPKSCHESRDAAEHVFRKKRNTIVCFTECGKRRNTARMYSTAITPHGLHHPLHFPASAHEAGTE